jgi:hypothetical protein
LAINKFLITHKAQQKPYYLIETQALWTVRSLPSMAVDTRFPAGMTLVVNQE